MKDYLQEIVPILDEYADKQADFEICNMAYPEFRQDIFKLLDNISPAPGESAPLLRTCGNLLKVAIKNPRAGLTWLPLRKRFFRYARVKLTKPSDRLSKIFLKIYRRFTRTPMRWSR